MEKLFDDSLLVSTERPTKINEQQEEQMFADLAKEAIEYRYSTSDAETIIEDLKELSINDTGFERAKDLEDNGNGHYEFNGDFIDWLGNMDYERNRLLRENVAAWVKAHNPKPKLEKGDFLKITESLSAQKDLRKDAEIYITGINMEQAYYTVSGDPDMNGGYAIAFERIEAQTEILKN